MASSSDEEGLAMERILSGQTNREESKKAVKGLLQHFSAFADKIHDASEQDVSDLQQQVHQVEGMAREGLDLEARERAKETHALQKRCEALERAVAALQREHSEGGPLQQRVDELENTFGAWADKHTRDVEMLRKTNDKLGKQFASLDAANEQHLDVEASLDTAVKGLTSAAEQTAKALAAAKAKLDHMQAGVSGCEQRCTALEAREAAVGHCSRELEALKSDHKNHSAQTKNKLKELDDFVAHHSTSHEDHRNLLQGLATNADRCAKTLAEAKKKADLAHDSAVSCEQRCAAAESKSAALADRLKDAERRLEGSVHSCSKDMEDLKHDHSKVKKQIAETHSAVEGLSSHKDETAKALAAAKAKLDHMHDGTASCEKRCAAAESKQAAMEERFMDAHRRLEGSLSSHSREMESLKGEHSSLSHQVRQHLEEARGLIDHHAASHKARHERHEENHGALAQKHEGHDRELRTLRDDHAKHGEELGHLRQTMHGALGELANNTASELKTTREELDQVLLLLAGVQRAWRPNARRISHRSGAGEEARTPKTPKTPKAGYEVSVDLLKGSLDA